MKRIIAIVSMMVVMVFAFESFALSDIKVNASSSVLVDYSKITKITKNDGYLMIKVSKKNAFTKNDKSLNKKKLKFKMKSGCKFYIKEFNRFDGSGSTKKVSLKKLKKTIKSYKGTTPAGLMELKISDGKVTKVVLTDAGWM